MDKLTSKCPFDCIFCSRSLLRGDGQHMDFGLFQSIVNQLDSPDMIRLNYSGESIHYPHLIEAIQAARATGAFTELVTAFASLPHEKIGPLVRSGLDRLTVSLHTLDEREFVRIYGYGTVHQMREKLSALRTSQRETGIYTPRLDFAFVAMHSNLDQLSAITEFAQELGVSEISVHPVIRRDDISEPFDVELLNSQFRPAFRREFNAAIRDARDRIPSVTISLSTRELDENPKLGHQPQYFCGSLPPRARIFSCDQNPWETIHILANGDVVVCEVRDKVIMGNLHESSLADIWHGSLYREFREKYQLGQTSPCDTCAYKTAYIPEPLHAGIAPGSSNGSQLFRGWYPPENNFSWSKKRSSALLLAEPGTERLRLRGLLPPGPAADNELVIHCDGKQIGSVRNTKAEPHSFDLALNLPVSPGQHRVDFTVQHVYKPASLGLTDVRQLGFALGAMWVSGRTRRRIGSLRLVPLLLAVQASRALAPLLSAVPRKRAKRLNWNPGISIIIPERSTPALLGDCIRSALTAAERLGGPTEMIVVVNGAPLQSYAHLQCKYPAVRWLHSSEPLGFWKAISRGLQAARFDWVYLLNSDMTLDGGALAEVAYWRTPDVFAVASQIFFTDSSQRREETGWTGAAENGRRVDIFDLVPEDAESVRTHLYAGGGSSLFQRDLLLAFSDSSDPYAPFYWEDVEWGFRALTAGYQVLFCPRSWAYHVHRATVKQFYAHSEIERIFSRNAWLFAVRNGFCPASPASLFRELTSMDAATQTELSDLSIAASIVRYSCRPTHWSSVGFDLKTVNNGVFLKPFSRSAARPRLLLVTPYAIWPATHGGARRIVALLERLGKMFDIIVLTDEGVAYKRDKLRHLPGVTAMHLVDGRPDDRGPKDRIQRIRTHSHHALQMEVKRLVRYYDVDLVQIEYVELAGLVDARTSGMPWFITLHDVLFSTEGNSKEDSFEAALLARFSGVVACTEADAKLVPRSRVTVIPNGVNAPTRPYQPSQGKQTMVFAGPFRYGPNLEGIVTFLENVYPNLRNTFPALDIDILGGDEGVAMARTKDCFEQPGVRIHPFTEDVQPFLERCALTINPLCNTHGSSLKLIESLAQGRVCVSTREGASGFAASELPGLVQVDRVQDFESAIGWLLTHEGERLQREIPPPDLVTRFSWQHSAELQAALYRPYLR